MSGISAQGGMVWVGTFYGSSGDWAGLVLGGRSGGGDRGPGAQAGVGGQSEQAWGLGRGQGAGPRAGLSGGPLAGTAGVMVSLSRILTKLLLPDERASTLIFFLVSAGLELLCFLLHLLVRRSRFVRYHTVRPRDSRPGHRAGYRVHHDVTSGDLHFVSPCPRCRLQLPQGRSPGSACT